MNDSCSISWTRLESGFDSIKASGASGDLYQFDPTDSPARNEISGREVIPRRLSGMETLCAWRHKSTGS